MASAASPSPKPAQARSRERREAILDAARESFLQRGYDGTTMSAIADTVGGSRATLWGNFPSKDALFDAVLDRLTEQFRAEIVQILNPADSVETALSRFCREYLTKVLSPEAIALQRLVIGEVNRSPEIGRIFHTRAAGLTRQQLARYFDGAIARGAMPECDTTVAASQLIGLCFSGNHSQLTLGLADSVSEEQVAQEADAVMRTFSRAFLGPD